MLKLTIVLVHCIYLKQIIGDSSFFKLNRTRGDYQGKLSEFDPLVDNLNFDKKLNVINFKINIRTKNMLSITLHHKVCVLSSIIKFISFYTTAHVFVIDQFALKTQVIHTVFST